MKKLLLVLALIATSVQGFAVQGTEGGGGGVTAEKGWKRYLLDLIEKDELEHFDPESILRRFNNHYESSASRLYISIRAMMRSLLDLDDESYRSCSKPLKMNDHESIYGSKKFLIVLGLTYSNPILNKYKSESNSGYCSLDQYNKLLSNLYTTYKLQPVSQLRWAFTDVELENLNDEGLIKIDNPESKRQVAIQKDGLVLINKKEFALLDAANQEALILHELVLRTVLVLNPTHVEKYGTQYIREYVRNTLKVLNARYDQVGQNKKIPPYYIITDSFKKLGID